MARTRSLKPSFFTDSDLSELSPLHRLAFQGLWCHADRDGRLEDKPRELKIQILPYDDADFEAILADLARPKGGRPGFILRYVVGGKRLIAITRWDHQRPHVKETSYNLPPPPRSSPGNSGASPGQAPTQHLLSTDSAPTQPGASTTGASPTGGASPAGHIGSDAGSLVLGVGSGCGNAAPKQPGAATPPPKSTVPTGGPDFFARCQEQRYAIHRIEEPRPPPEFDGWWPAAMEAVRGDVTRLDAAYRAFLADPYWRTKAHPFRAFLGGRDSPGKWREYVALGETAERPSPKMVPVSKAVGT